MARVCRKTWSLPRRVDQSRQGSKNSFALSRMLSAASAARAHFGLGHEALGSSLLGRGGQRSQRGFPPPMCAAPDGWRAPRQCSASSGRNADSRSACRDDGRRRYAADAAPYKQEAFAVSRWLPCYPSAHTTGRRPERSRGVRTRSGVRRAAARSSPQAANRGSVCSCGMGSIVGGGD